MQHVNLRNALAAAPNILKEPLATIERRDTKRGILVAFACGSRIPTDASETLGPLFAIDTAGFILEATIWAIDSAASQAQSSSGFACSVPNGSLCHRGVKYRNRKYGDRSPTDQSTANRLFFLNSALYVVEQAAVVDLYRLKPRETFVSTLLDARSMLRASRSSR
ncbi:uncharacterized protein ARMOST_21364 [Armillaria ostoyae]|uniref:Uncharacterized protein n=1 Tax=Armillaria ostoyae TaxID=47428 RepID=A0A284S9X5_ARMOS|nr:uncharacterized protein ARMOST_21364 [Armillaria ostoyae]